jgi:hypothetical protein
VRKLVAQQCQRRVVGQVGQRPLRRAVAVVDNGIDAGPPHVVELLPQYLRVFALIVAGQRVVLAVEFFNVPPVARIGLVMGREPYGDGAVVAGADCLLFIHVMCSQFGTLERWNVETLER